MGQEFISTACIEHLDFLYIDPDEANIYKPVTEKNTEQQFRSLTNISVRPTKEETDATWSNYDVSLPLVIISSYNMQYNYKMVLTGATAEVHMGPDTDLPLHRQPLLQGPGPTGPAQQRGPVLQI